MFCFEEADLNPSLVAVGEVNRFGNPVGG